MTTVDLEPMDGWNAVPWAKAERAVFKLQKRIYRASQRGDAAAVHRLQRLLTRSRSARYVATRKVTQDNRGKKTAGVDGVKALTPKQRLAEAASLRFDGKAAPARRVWIPKPGTNERRGLAIPTVHDRAKQSLARLALEPEWEARFEPNNYGFRPGRSCWDAIEAIFIAICHKAKYALETDVEKCFDRIDHTALLQKMATYPHLRRQLRAWLRAGILDGGKLFPTEEGTPQGGPLSPLLANIALHGLESAVRQAFPRWDRGPFPAPILVRYADDLVVLHPDRDTVVKCQDILAEALRPMGLSLKPSKTRIVHTLEEMGEGPGFDFLGFNVRQHRVGKTRTGTGTRGRPLGFKTIITPSKEAVRRHYRALSRLVEEQRTAEQAKLIHTLSPVIAGWANYYSTKCSKRTFTKLDHLLFVKLRAWAERRHPNKGRRWVAGKYWRIDEGHGWTFRPRGSQNRLLRHSEMPIRRHVKIQGSRSTFDGDWVYWSARTGRYPGTTPRVARLLKKQQGRCLWCGLYFRPEEKPEVDHVIPRALGGRDGYHNWQLLHRHCHDAKTADDLAEMRRTEQIAAEIRGMNAKHRATEEPCDGNLSRTVLKPSRGGDAPA